MRKITKTALLTTAAPRAFENKPGWKMDGDKLALDSEGNPIYVNSAGAEQSVKGDTISNVQGEARGHRLAKEKAEEQLAKYRDGTGKLIDPEIAVKAVETVGKIDAKKLIDAGEVDKVREQIKAEFTSQLAEKDMALEATKGENTQLRIARTFDSSEFVRDQLAVPRDMFEATFGKNIKIGENGETEFYGRDGNRLLSKKNAGEFAKGDEAFELLVDQHPQKDAIIKAQQTGGSGNGGGGGARGQGRTMKRADFDALDPGAKAQAGAAMGKGELSVVD